MGEPRYGDEGSNGCPECTAVAKKKGVNRVPGNS